MRLRATTYIRNDRMLAARTRLEYSQRRLALEVGCSVALIQRLERLDYPPRIDINTLDSLSIVLNVPSKQIMPPELVGQRLVSKYLQVEAVDSMALLAACETRQRRLVAADPSELMEQKENREIQLYRILSALRTCTKRRQVYCRLRYGINHSRSHKLGEIARRFHVSIETVRHGAGHALYQITRRLPWIERLTDDDWFEITQNRINLATTEYRRIATYPPNPPKIFRLGKWR